MVDVMLANLLILIGLVPVGVFVCWIILRGLDKLNGISFSNDVYPKIKESPLATSIYFGSRFVGVLYFISVMFSRFV